MAGAKAWLAAAFLGLGAAPAGAQIDDAERFLLQGGYEQGLAEPGPKAPYVFAYINRPGVYGSSTTLRLALAPVYLDSEVGIANAFGHWSDAGIGLSGGGYAFGQSEVFRGDEKRGEAFIGHGGGPSFTAYPHLGGIGPVPLSGVVRVAASYADYIRDAATAPEFALPRDEWTGSFRAGLRFGGQEPGLDTAPAMELSTWWETRVREHSGAYGYNGDRMAQGRTDLYWSRLLFAYTTDSGKRIGLGASFGAGTGVDRFSAYRLGGMLTQNSEFPLILPGYFSQEIAARRFGHVWLRGGLPLDDRRKLIVNLFAAGASIAPVDGTDSGGTRHMGVGAGLEFTPIKGALSGMLTYGYSPTALRRGGRGGQGIALSFEVNFETPLKLTGHPMTPQQGLRWLLGSLAR
jgi:hypothetical protein